MEIISRTQASKRMLPTFFTGKSCRRGHLAARYTTNGGCVVCVRAKSEDARIAANATPRRQQLASLVSVGMRLFHEDVPAFTDVALAMVRAEFPDLTRADVVHGKPSGVAAGTGFYPFRVRAQDVQMLRDVATAYRSARSPNFEEVREGVLAATLTMANEQAVKDNGVGEWKFT